jgi:uncharacterized membrane protein
MNNMSRTSYIAVNGVGIALFVVLTMCLQVPVFENYYLCLGYLVMMVYCRRFGPFSGALVGGAGVILYCVLTGGLRGMPGWTLGNILIGAVLGQWFGFIKRVQNRKKAVGEEHRGDVFSLRWMGATAIIVVAITAAGILGVKSLTEALLYAQPMAVRVIKNSYAFAADAFVLIAALPLSTMTGRHLREGAAA